MRTYLEHDGETGRLMLVMADYWDGQHERTAFTVAGPSGNPVRGREDLDGLAARPSGMHDGIYYVYPLPATGRPLEVRTVAGERSACVKTPCPKATNARRKCALCS
jgi:hypothetical protein